MPKIPYNKRPDGRYYKQIVIGFDENGKRKVKTLYDRNWRELDKKVREFQLSLDNDTYIKKDITFGECVDLWWQTKVDISPSSRQVYKSALKNVEQILYLQIKDITVRHIQNVYDQMYKLGRKSLISKLSSLLKSIFEYAKRNYYINKNIVKDVTIPKYKNTKKRRSLTDNEKHAIFMTMNDLKPVYKAMINILLYTGMRRNEMLDLKVSDINFEENYIYVQRTLTYGENYRSYEKDTTKTPAGVRKIPMVAELKNTLSEYINNYVNNKQGYLFLSRNQTFITSSNFNDKWKRILEKINAYMPENEKTDISPHYFRHNYATELIYAGVPLKTVQYIMGHENIDITMNIYADVKVNTQDVINQLSQYYRKSM